MPMSIVGLLVFIVAGAASGWLVRLSVEQPGVRGAAAGLAAPVAVLIALAGAILLFVPGFFG